jgi:hypothetical protein
MESSLEILQGGIRLYAESQLDALNRALFEFQQKKDTKAAVMVPLTYTLGQVCHSPIAAESLLYQIDNVNSSRSLSFIFMTRPLLRKYSTIS